jgi:hypothetical protein
MKILLSILLAFILPSITSADELEQSRIQLEAQKKIHISKSLTLSHNESEPFWNLYAEYEKELATAQRDYFNLIREFSDGYKNNNLTDAQATQLLSRYFEIEETKVAIKKSYLPRYQQVLSSKKVMRFYQIDNKIDSHIRCDIAEKMPMIEPDR